MYAVGAIPFTEPQKVSELIIKAAALGADFVEFRLDYWTRESLPEFEGLVSLAERYGMKVIVTVRSPKEGGKWDPPWKLEAYRKADELGLVCDFEVKLWDEAPCKNSIASVHYFKEPPKQGEVKRLSERALGLGSWVFKLATVVNDELAYFSSVRESAHPRIAFMPMGEGTERLRLASAVLGSFLNYGSVGAPTAPGQVSLDVLSRVLRSLPL